MWIIKYGILFSSVVVNQAGVITESSNKKLALLIGRKISEFKCRVECYM
jgi:hypothetical protein